MHLAGASTGRIEGVSRILQGAGVSAGTVSDPNDKASAPVEEWRNRLLEGGHPYVFVDGVCLKCGRGGSRENVSAMVTIGVDGDCDDEAVCLVNSFWAEWSSIFEQFAHLECAAFLSTYPSCMSALRTR